MTKQRVCEKDLDLFRLHETPYGWPFRLLRIPQAHRVTRGSPDVVVAVIDLGYTGHPQHEGHLWVNPDSSSPAVHGWDCHDDDAGLEYNLENADSDYNRGHHAFVAGEVMACAPLCPVMIVRVGYGNKASWWKGIDWAVEHGARILVMPHGFLSHGPGDSPIPLFYRGTDFGYPVDNPRLRESLERAWERGCLIVSGTADNRGRRVASAAVALEGVVALGSVNKRGEPADICASADYVEAATPSGERAGKPRYEHVWGTSGYGDFIPFTGGCMAAGFGGGVAALAWSRFPQLSNRQIRQLLRNTARGNGWNTKTGYGVYDALKAVSVKEKDLRQAPTVLKTGCALRRRVLHLTIENKGVFDIERCLVVAYNGDPARPGAPRGTMAKPIILATRQIGHSITGVRGFHRSSCRIELTEAPERSLWLELSSLDQGGAPGSTTADLSSLTPTAARSVAGKAGGSAPRSPAAC